MLCWFQWKSKNSSTLFFPLPQAASFLEDVKATSEGRLFLLKRFRKRGLTHEFLVSCSINKDFSNFNDMISFVCFVVPQSLKHQFCLLSGLNLSILMDGFHYFLSFNEHMIFLWLEINFKKIYFLFKFNL